MASERVAIIDYGAGNVLNVLRAFQRSRVETEIVTHGVDLLRYSHAVLPGVGSFRFGMDALNERGLTDPICKFFDRGRPILGICLGMQLFAESSSEHGRTKGLGLVSGNVEHLSSVLQDGRTPASGRIPHTGWSRVRWNLEVTSPAAHPIDTAYFNHSFVLDGASSNQVVATAGTGGQIFPAAVQVGTLFATQFHPEKSGPAGLDFLSAWVMTDKCG